MLFEEKEIKILNIDVASLQSTLNKIGAKKVYDGERIFTTFDNRNRAFSKGKGVIRLTEEDKLKLSVSDYNSKNKKETVKLFVSRKKETLALLAKLGFYPICEVKSRRISYEFGEIDIDIDIFPRIPPFVEIDLDKLQCPLDTFLEKIGLLGKKQFDGGTEDIYARYGINYFTKFKIGSNKIH